MTSYYDDDYPNPCRGVSTPGLKEKTVTPATQFYIITQVVMVEHEPQREDPPGRAPYKEVKTVLTEDRKEIRRHEVSDAVAKVNK